MPSFQGEKDDNFESWALCVKRCLVFGVNYTQKQKEDVILTKIRDHALQALEQGGDMTNIEIVFSALQKTYVKIQRAYYPISNNFH